MVLIRIIRSLLSPWPRASAYARSLYHLVFFSWRRRTVECAGITAVFATPTPTLDEQVRSFTGEEAVLVDFLTNLRDGDVVWDVGSGYGLYAVLAARRLGAAGLVHAFEPGERISGLLLRNLRLNQGAAVRHLPIALGAREGRVAMFEPDSPNPGTGSLADRRDYRVRKRVEDVEVRSGDGLVESGTLPAPTVVKIDTEGAEGRILAGMQRVLRSGRVRALYCEVHPHLLPQFGDTDASVEAALVAAGFSITGRHERGTEYHLIARSMP